MFQQRAVVHPRALANERPVRTPYAGLGAKGFEQGVDVGTALLQQGIGGGELLHARQFHAGPATVGQPQQGLEASLLHPGGYIRAATVIDQQTRSGALQQAMQVQQLVFAHLHLGKQAKLGDLAEQPVNVLEAGHPVQRGVEGDTDHPLRLQRSQRIERDTCLDHRHALEPPVPGGQGVQQAAVVGVVAAVGADEQGMLYTVGVHHAGELLLGRHLLARGRIRCLGVVRETGGIKQMVMAIDLRFVKDVHAALPASIAARACRSCYCAPQGRFGCVQDTAWPGLTLIPRWRRP